MDPPTKSAEVYPFPNAEGASAEPYVYTPSGPAWVPPPSLVAAPYYSPPPLNGAPPASTAVFRYSPPPVVASESACCCGGGTSISQHTIPSELLYSLPGIVSCASLGLTIFFLIHGGWCQMSSILLISASAILFNAAPQRQVTSPDTCCSGRRLPTIRNLAVAAIVFASFELILGIALGLGLGGGIGQPLDGKSSSSSTRLAVCGLSQTGLSTCLSSVTSATLTNIASSGR